ncbi:Kinesin-like protein [Abeliophyllum distichum]|uniref:Kinesin-like protein n=1 Tax=Abeliophyllum distichum TaxID=126358 RepID=A0ABD1VB71_9LAMI
MSSWLDIWFIRLKLRDDTNNNQNSSLLLLKKPDFGFSGSEKQGTEVETETLHCYDVVQDSPSGDVAYDATLVSPEMVVHEIQEPPCSCVVKFVDDEIDSRTAKKQEDFADDAIDSRTVTKQEGKFADDAITSKKLEEKFYDDAIDSRSVTKQEKRKFYVDAITVKKEAEKFADDAIDSMTVKKQEDTFADDATDSRTLKKQEKFESLEKCTLKIQVIDETALIESPCLGNGTFNNGKCHETQGIKLKRPRRRGSKAAKNLETSGTRSQDCGYTGKKGKKRLVYSREEMEALRYVGLEAQKNMWIGIYCGLGPVVAKEYDELTHQKHNATSFDFDPRPQFLKASVPRRFFDRVFRGDCTTREVYEEGTKDIALSVVGGINSTIFAYGQTSSGKTYTMNGITEYAVADIYDYIQRHEERAFVLKFSAVEIYNEVVRDLLGTDNAPLRLLDDPEINLHSESLSSLDVALNDENHSFGLGRTPLIPKVLLLLVIVPLNCDIASLKP